MIYLSDSAVQCQPWLGATVSIIMCLSEVSVNLQGMVFFPKAEFMILHLLAKKKIVLC